MPNLDSAPLLAVMGQVRAIPSLKVDPDQVRVLTRLVKLSIMSQPKNAESESSRCRVLTRTHH